MEKFTPLATNFTLPPALTAWTNSTSASYYNNICAKEWGVISAQVFLQLSANRKYGEDDIIVSFDVSISLQFPLIHVAKQMYCKPLHTRRWRSSGPFAFLVNQKC